MNQRKALLHHAMGCMKEDLFVYLYLLGSGPHSTLYLIYNTLADPVHRISI